MAASPVGRQVASLDRSGLVSTRGLPRAGPPSVRQAFGLRRPSVGNAGSGSWIQRSPRLLSRWGTLHDVYADQRSAKLWSALTACPRCAVVLFLSAGPWASVSGSTRPGVTSRRCPAKGGADRPLGVAAWAGADCRRRRRDRRSAQECGQADESIARRASTRPVRSTPPRGHDQHEPAD